MEKVWAERFLEGNINQKTIRGDKIRSHTSKSKPICESEMTSNVLTVMRLLSNIVSLYWSILILNNKGFCDDFVDNDFMVNCFLDLG